MHIFLRTFVSVSCLAVTLVGCSSLPTPPAAVVRYDLGLAPAATAVQASAVTLPAVALATLQAPPQAEESTAMHYRLQYAQGQVQHAYQQARWAVPPAQLVQQRLQAHLGQGARTLLSAQAGQVPPAVQGQQVPVLRWALEEFSHVFSSAQDSAGWVRVRATLVHPAPQGDVLVAQQVFEVRQSASAPNAAAGVQALAQAVDAVGQQMQAWLTAQWPPR